MSSNRRDLPGSGTGRMICAGYSAWAEVTERYHSGHFSFLGSYAKDPGYLTHDDDRGQTPPAGAIPASRRSTAIRRRQG